MNIFSAISLCGAAAGIFLALGVLVTGRRGSVSRWLFAAGMLLVAMRIAAGARGMELAFGAGADRWHGASLAAGALIPGVWIAFSLCYARGDRRRALFRWRYALAAAVAVPVGLAVWILTGLAGAQGMTAEEPALGGMSYGAGSLLLEAVTLAAAVAVVANVEQTLRAAMGTARWRVQYVLIGLCAIFGARAYTATQALLYERWELPLAGIEGAGFLTGCALMGVAWMRRGFAEIDLYPSRMMLQRSATVLLAGAYLVVLGGLAHVAARFGSAENFPLQALLVTPGLALLALLLMSRRLQHRMRTFVSRHFRRPHYDSRAVWTRFTLGLPAASGESEYCRAAVNLVAETFGVLSVSLWRPDSSDGSLGLTCRASTAGAREADAQPGVDARQTEAVLAGMRELGAPFDLEARDDPWAAALRALHTSCFRDGGNRYCVPLVSADRAMGLMILADRVNAAPYSVEDIDLLKCAAGQIAAGLHQQQLTAELMQGRELEAFQTMSTFFVHDLKNAAAGLNLTLENLPVHFDDPEFRADALRTLRATAGRIQQVTSRLSSLRRHLEPDLAAADLNAVVRQSLEGVHRRPEIAIAQDLHPLPPVLADSAQLETVVTNLLLNACEAVNGDGRVTVSTAFEGGNAVLSVADNGCGMTPAFLRESLFRPFRSTKQKGLGIGMFQSRMIVEAHRGTMAVKSEAGSGTTFRISLPALIEQT